MESIVYFETVNGVSIYTADALWVESEGDPTEEVKFGLLSDDLNMYVHRGQAATFAQFYKLVLPGIILAKHIFKGLDRPLLCDNNVCGDQDKRVYSRRPVNDYTYDRSASRVVQHLAPAGKVFVVIVSPNTHLEEYPDIKAWIDHWCWVDEDKIFNDAPTDWVDRYNCKIWTQT